MNAKPFLSAPGAERRALGDDVVTETPDEDTDTVLSDERYGHLSANEQFVLTIADDGLGKRTSSFRYACKGRGGKGMVAQILGRGKGVDDAKLVRSFIVEDTDQIMLVTDGGQLIRTPVKNISISQRSAKGVWVLRTKEGERVVSIGRIEDSDDDGDEDGAEQEDGTEQSGVTDEKDSGATT